jgi:hypothetical protein
VQRWGGGGGVTQVEESAGGGDVAGMCSCCCGRRHRSWLPCYEGSLLLWKAGWGCDTAAVQRRCSVLPCVLLPCVLLPCVLLPWPPWRRVQLTRCAGTTRQCPPGQHLQAWPAADKQHCCGHVNVNAAQQRQATPAAAPCTHLAHHGQLAERPAAQHALPLVQGQLQEGQQEGPAADECPAPAQQQRAPSGGQQPQQPAADGVAG